MRFQVCISTLLLFANLGLYYFLPQAVCNKNMKFQLATVEIYLSSGTQAPVDQTRTVKAQAQQWLAVTLKLNVIMGKCLHTVIAACCRQFIGIFYGWFSQRNELKGAHAFCETGITPSESAFASQLSKYWTGSTWNWLVSVPWARLWSSKAVKALGLSQLWPRFEIIFSRWGKNSDYVDQVDICPVRRLGWIAQSIRTIFHQVLTFGPFLWRNTHVPLCVASNKVNMTGSFWATLVWTLFCMHNISYSIALLNGTKAHLSYF